MQVSVFIATSLDGFIARKNGAIDWLPEPDTTAAGEDYGYQAFFASIDAIVMGRHTYELVRSFGEWPYGDKRLVVLSHGSVTIPAELSSCVTHLAASPLEICEHLAAEGATHVYVDGGKTIQSFLSAGLINDMTISTIPVLIGAGLPLFGPLPHDLTLQHQATRTFANGVVQTHYRVR